MPRPRVHDDRMRATLLEVASRLIAERGSAALSVRDVAAQSATSTTAVYALFGGRDALVTAVRAEAETRFSRHLNDAVRTDNPGADLAELGLAYRRSALQDPHFYRIVFDTVGGPGPDRPTFEVLVRAVQRCADAGLLVPGDVRSYAGTLWALVHGMVALELIDGIPGTPAERESAFRDGLRRMWDGIGATWTRSTPPD